jgi:hypothetical protein
MTEPKTKPTALNVDDYLNAITDDVRRTDCVKLSLIMAAVTGEPAIMWGSSIVGFGSYKYKYASGHEGETMKLGFSSRKDSIVLYGVIQYEENTALLEQLGKFSRGKGCLYIKKLSDVNLDVLEQMMKDSSR